MSNIPDIKRCDNCAYLETIESPIGNIKVCGLYRVQNIAEVVLVNCPRFNKCCDDIKECEHIKENKEK